MSRPEAVVIAIVVPVLAVVVGIGAGLLAEALVLPTGSVSTDVLREGGRIDAQANELLKQAREQGQKRAAYTGRGVGLLSGGTLLLLLCCRAVARVKPQATTPAQDSVQEETPDGSTRPADESQQSKAVSNKHGNAGGAKR